jgi:hypothetical protein
MVWVWGAGRVPLYDPFQTLGFLTHLKLLPRAVARKVIQTMVLEYVGGLLICLRSEMSFVSCDLSWNGRFCFQHFVFDAKRGFAQASV